MALPEHPECPLVVQRHRPSNKGVMSQPRPPSRGGLPLPGGAPAVPPGVFHMHMPMPTVNRQTSVAAKFRPMTGAVNNSIMGFPSHQGRILYFGVFQSHDAMVGTVLPPGMRPPSAAGNRLSTAARIPTSMAGETFSLFVFLSFFLRLSLSLSISLKQHGYARQNITCIVNMA